MSANVSNARGWDKNGEESNSSRELAALSLKHPPKEIPPATQINTAIACFKAAFFYSGYKPPRI